MRCSSYCTADGYNVDELAKFLRDRGYEPKFYDKVIHIHLSSDDTEIAEAFFFHYGCVTFWGLSVTDEQNFLEEVSAFEISPLQKHTQDHCEFEDGNETEICEEDDNIILGSNDILIKLSLSHGLSQSVKLQQFEDEIEKTIKRTEHIPLQLAENGKIFLSRKEIAQQIGVLFAQRNSVNLNCNILDTPEFFWKRPRYEHYYLLAAKYMDIGIRLDILNKRLDVIHELYDILSNELKHAHSYILELTIVLLIVTEVVMSILKDFLKWV